jgi:RND family efflux transporter MFP subunit
MLAFLTATPRAALLVGTALTLTLLASCGRSTSEPAAAAETEPWAVTAWGERYELFPEIDPLIAGATATSHTHVTVLDGFSPLAEGRVEIVLRSPEGREEVFAATAALRPGIFKVEITPGTVGERELIFRIDAAAGREEIPGGRVRVGTPAEPGGPTDGPEEEGEVGFLKEQQWKTPFATAGAVVGELRDTVRGPGEVVARPGGERLLTAPAAGRIDGEPWPHVGRQYRRGQTLFELVPRLDPDVSLAELESEVAALAADLVPLEARVARLDRLATVGAVAQEEVELAHGEKTALEARLEGARRNLRMALESRNGAASSGDRLRLVAPFDAAIASVTATPGQAVEAGAALARFVATEPLWIAASLPPAEAASLVPGPIDLALRLAGDRVIEVAPGGARLVARAPAVDPGTGRVEVLIELPVEIAGLPIGLTVEVEVGAGAARSGVVLPATALVDDAGLAVGYVQIGGESFSRREVQVLARRGATVLVSGIEPGERVVTLGGGAIRRSTLVGSGVGEAHVH